MANTKLTALTALTGATTAKNDKLYIGDVSAGTSGSKSITISEMAEAERLWRNPQTIYVNDFYPAAVTAKHDGSSNPLSDFYGSLAAAEADFPHIDFTEWGIELTDEVDWVAWMSASQWMYDNRPDPTLSVGYDYSCWKLVADGDYWVNKSIIFTPASIWITGSAGRPFRLAVGGGTSITYNGPEGTDTDKVYVIDHYSQDDPGARPPPPGSAPTPHPNRDIGGGTGGSFRMTDMLIMGRSGGGHTVTIANSPSTSGVGYVVGVRLRDAYFGDITGCAFGGSLLDAIWISSALWMRVSFNFFYDIYRDCVAVVAFPEDFSSTTWIDDNEFGYYGRYAIIMDYFGGVEPSPSVRRNSIEGASTVHYYHTHLEEWVQGVRASICHIGAGVGQYGNYYENRCEGTVYQSANMWGDLHLIGGLNVSVRDNRFTNIVLSTFKSSAAVTSAYTTFRDTYKYVDINAERNFNAPEVGDYDGGGQASNCVFDGNIEGKIVNIAGVSISAGSGNSYRSGTVTFVAPETYSGTYIRQVRAPGAGYVTMGAVEQGASFLNFSDLSFMYGPMTNAIYGNATGHFNVLPAASSGFGTWTADTVYNDKLRATNTEVAAGAGKTSDKWVYPTVFNGCIYEASATTGTRKSHATTEPTWPTTLAATVVDNEVTWTCVRTGILPYDSGYKACVVQFSKRIVQRNTAPPTTGLWYAGDMCYTRIPDQTTPAVWICVTQGTPGTWIPLGNDYGYIAVGSLPAASTAIAGTRAVVSDSNQTLSAGLGSTVASGGSNKVPVYCDGSAWKIG
jgi:hypothetical protein